MKVLYDHQIFTLQKFGGISRYFNEIMKLNDVGTQVDRIDPALFAREDTETNSSILSRGKRFLERKLKIQGDENITVFPKEVIKTLSKGDFDIFHPTYYDPYFTKWNNKPFVLTVYDMIHEIYREHFSIDDPTSRNKLMLCNKASKIIAISQKTKDDLLKIYNLPEEKIQAIPLASDFDQVSAVKPESTNELKRYILFVGSRHAYKNFYYPITALADVLKSDDDLQILCTGLPFSPAEISFFKDLGVEQQMKHIFLKSDQELAWAYKNAALFIFPSLYEGFGFPILEAFASGCPVVSSTGGSLPEVGGDATLYFDPKDIKQIQMTACSVLYGSEVRDSLIMKGLERYKEFSWDKCRLETAKVYKSIVL